MNSLFSKIHPANEHQQVEKEQNPAAVNSASEGFTVSFLCNPFRVLCFVGYVSPQGGVPRGAGLTLG
jgi:hypothetical protein